MTIEKVEVWDFCPKFRKGRYVMSHVTNDGSHGQVLRLHTSDGQRGLGEVVFPPVVSQSERLQRKSDEQRYLANLIEKDVDTLIALAGSIRDLGMSWRGFAFALETAYFDVEGHRTNKSLADILGGARQGFADDYLSISENSNEEIHERSD